MNVHTSILPSTQHDHFTTVSKNHNTLTGGHWCVWRKDWKHAALSFHLCPFPLRPGCCVAAGKSRGGGGGRGQTEWRLSSDRALAEMAARRRVHVAVPQGFNYSGGSERQRRLRNSHFEEEDEIFRNGALKQGSESISSESSCHIRPHDESPTSIQVTF